MCPDIPGASPRSGEKTVKAHYPESNTDAPVTIVFKYTLTTTRPKK